MAYYHLQADFSKGQISPLLGSRADVDFWRQSLFECLNFNVLVHGGVRRRSGTRFVAEVKDSTAVARILPFKFSETQTYVLGLNGGAIRFYAQRGVVGSPYEVNHPYLDGDLFAIAYEQSNDVAYFAHKDYAPRKLERFSDLNWSLSSFVFKDGPYLIANTTSTRLTLSSRGAISSRPGTASATAGTASAAFDGNNGTDWGTEDANTGTLTYTLTGGATAVCDAYYIRASGKQDPTSAPASWEFQGWTGSTWVTLDARQAENGWSRGEVRFYEFPNETAYSAYRLVVQGTNYTGEDKLYLAELGMAESGDTMSPITLTASSTTGINDGQGFLASDVGRTIRLRGADNRWRWARIVSRTSSTSVTVRLHGHALPNLSPITSWQMGAFSAETGFPGAVVLFNERLMWARTDLEPVTVFGSRQGSFDEYGVSNPQLDTDGIKITLLSSGMNEILWLAGEDDLVTGSAGQIRTVGPADLNKSFSATNVTQRKGPTSGSAKIQPLSIGGVTLYVGSGGTKIRELVMGEQGRYVAPELSLLGEHFFKSGIKDWAFMERPDPTIYCVMGNGELVTLTYDREQRIVGFGRHQIAGGHVESVAVIPSVEPGFEDVYLVVRRTINGQEKRYIEVLERPFDGDIDAVEDAVHVDCSLTYEGTAISTVTGLDHLEGETVSVLADGGVVEGLVVDNGEITLPTAASKITVGLPYRSRGVTLPVAGPQQDGTLLGRRRTIQGVSADVLYSGAMMMGAAGGDGWEPPLYEQIFKPGNLLIGNSVSLVTGNVQCQIEGSWTQGDGKIIFETDKPLPLLIRSLTLHLEGEP